MTPKGACLACRVRKVRCIPATPRCLRCTELGIDECVYASVKKRGAGNTLGVRMACQPCRDATQSSPVPHVPRMEGPCIRKKLPAAPQTFPFSSKNEPSPHPSPPFPTNSEDPSPPPPDIASPGARSSVFPSLDQTLSDSSARESYLPEPGMLDEFKPPAPQKWTIPEMELVPFQESPKPRRRTTMSIFSPLPSLNLLSIPRPLRTSLSFLGPEHFQVSDTTSSELDLDLAFRLAALLRLRLFGIYLPAPKQDAILRGDLSNTVVHPFFVHALAGLGMYFCAGVGYSHTIVLLLAKYAQRTWEQIAEINTGNDPNLTIQAFFSLTSMTLHSRWLDSARKFLTRPCIALNAAGLRFVPVTDRPPELTEDVRERVVALSQIIYLENYIFLVVDGTEPRMTVRIQKEFRHDLQQTYPHLFEICPLIMRTQGILLVKDAISITTLCSAGRIKPEQWKQICDGPVTSLGEYSDTLLQNIRTFLRIGDTQGAEIIQSSCVCCLAHLAVLCDLISSSEPNSRPQMDAVCDSSLQRLGRVTQEMRFEGYTYFDLLLRVSWKRSLTAFDSRIENLSDEESEESISLRQSREIVAKAHSDIDARLPDPFPPPLSANLVFLDDRDEGSEHPNFMLSSVRASHSL